MIKFCETFKYNSYIFFRNWFNSQQAQIQSPEKRKYYVTPKRPNKPTTARAVKT
jgi:hypothetical protein